MAVVLAEADAGIDGDARRGRCRRPCRPRPARREVADIPRRICIGRARPAWCEARPACASAPPTRRSGRARSRLAGIAVSAVTSLTMVAPAANACRITWAWRVSTETVAPALRPVPRTPGSRGATLRRARRGRAPGRVEFAAHIEQVGALLHQPDGHARRPRRLGEIAAVGEAVRRHIDHAHDAGDRASARRRTGAAGQPRARGSIRRRPRRAGARQSARAGGAGQHSASSSRVTISQRLKARGPREPRGAPRTAAMARERAGRPPIRRRGSPRASKASNPAEGRRALAVIGHPCG